MVFEAADGLHDVFANGFPAPPLRFTFRGRLELPVNVENMAAAVTSGVDALSGIARHGIYPINMLCGSSKAFCTAVICCRVLALKDSGEEIWQGTGQTCAG